MSGNDFIDLLVPDKSLMASLNDFKVLELLKQIYLKTKAMHHLMNLCKR